MKDETKREQLDRYDNTAFEISPAQERLSVLNVHEIAPGFKVSVFHPATTPEALTAPRLYRYFANRHGICVDFAAGIGPKSSEGRLVADDFYLAHGCFPSKEGHVEIVLVDQYDGISSGKPGVFRETLNRILKERGGDFFQAPNSVKLPRLLADAEGLFSCPDGRLRDTVDADNLAVLVQRGFYREFGDLNRHWLAKFAEEVASTLADDVPQHYKDTKLRELVSSAIGVFSRVRAEFSVKYIRDVREAFSRFDTTIMGMRSNTIEPVWKGVWGDSIYTTGLNLLYRSDSGIKVTNCLLRSLADSFIVSIYTDCTGGRSRSIEDYMIADTNYQIDFFNEIATGVAPGCGVSEVYRDLVHGTLKPGGVYSTRNSSLGECRVYGTLESPELDTAQTPPLTEMCVHTYSLMGGSSLEIYHMSDGACFPNRSAARYGTHPHDLGRVISEFGSNPDAFLYNMETTTRHDDWIIARLSLLSQST